MADFQKQIADIDVKVYTLTNDLATLIPAMNDWQRASDSLSCNSGTSKKKRKCNDDKAFKSGKAQYYRSRISATNIQISELNETKDGLVASQKAKDEATINLSTTGQSLEALVIKADGEAEAQREAAQIMATAQAEATKLKASVDAENSTKEAVADLENSEKQSNTMMIVIVVVVLIGVAFGVMKLKKMAK